MVFSPSDFRSMDARRLRPTSPADLVRATADLALDGLPVATVVGGTRQHGVLRGDPTEAAALAPTGNALRHARGDQHPRLAVLHQHRALGVSSHPRVMLTVRSSSLARPSGRDTGCPPSGGSRDRRSRRHERARPARRTRRWRRPRLVCSSIQGGMWVSTSLFAPARWGVLGGLPAVEVQVLRVGRVVGERGLAEQQVGVPGQLDEGVGQPRVGGVGEAGAVGRDPHAECLDRVVHVGQVDREGAEVEPPTARSGSRTRRENRCEAWCLRR